MIPRNELPPPTPEHLQVILDLCPVTKCFLAVDGNNEGRIEEFGIGLEKLSDEVLKCYPDYVNKQFAPVLARISLNYDLIEMEEEEWDNFCHMLNSMLLLGYEVANPDITAKVGIQAQARMLYVLMDHAGRLLEPAEFLEGGDEEGARVVLSAFFVQGMLLRSEETQDQTLGRLLEGVKLD